MCYLDYRESGDGVDDFCTMEAGRLRAPRASDSMGTMTIRSVLDLEGCGGAGAQPVQTPHPPMRLLRPCKARKRPRERYAALAPIARKTRMCWDQRGIGFRRIQHSKTWSLEVTMPSVMRKFASRPGIPPGTP